MLHDPSLVLTHIQNKKYLSEVDEAILYYLREATRLQYENATLRDEIRDLNKKLMEIK